MDKNTGRDILLMPPVDISVEADRDWIKIHECAMLWLFNKESFPFPF